MRRLNLDYQQLPDQPRKFAGWALLIAGLVLLTEMGISYDRLQNEREAMNKEVRTSKLHLDAPKRQSRSYTDKDYEAAEQIMSRLSENWEALFADIESVKNDNVAILLIEPEKETGQLRLMGEAKDYASVLTLVAQLRARRSFADVFLQQHEIKRDDPQHPVNFTVSMRWVKPS